MSARLDIVTFGYYAGLLTVNTFEYPQRGSVTEIQLQTRGIAADAAIIAFMMNKWGFSCGFISNDVGQDSLGKELFDSLRESGITTTVTPRVNRETPLTIVLNDKTHQKTVLTGAPSVSGDLTRVDLSILHMTSWMYVDAYDHMLVPAARAITYAKSRGITVLTNLGTYDDVMRVIERGVGKHSPASCKRALRKVMAGSLVIQVSLDGQSAKTAKRISALHSRLCRSTCLYTLGSEGAIGIKSTGESPLAKAPKIDVVNTAGAGAAFSAGILYGLQKGWELKETLRFAVASGSFQCTKKDTRDFSAIEAIFEFKEKYLRCDVTSG